MTNPTLTRVQPELTARSVNNVILRNEGSDLAVLRSLISRFLLGQLLLAFLGGLLCGGGPRRLVVVVLTVFALCIVLSTTLQRATAPGP